MNQYFEQAKNVVISSCYPRGIVASTHSHANYERVWARDSVICGLSGLVTGDETICEGLKQSLLSLAEMQGPQGEIPSGVSFDSNGHLQDVSYGSLVGRVDAPGWFVIGACHYLMQFPEAEAELMPAIEKSLDLYHYWEFNNRGLVYTPQGGNWADEYYLEGYLLYDQLIRLWARICYHKLINKKIPLEGNKHSLRVNFWPEESNKDHAYHPRAFAAALNSPICGKHWFSGFKSDGYFENFDLFSHALTMLLQINTPEQEKQVIANTDKLQQQLSSSLLPAFWPVVEESNPLWSGMQINCGPEFKNHPFEYHNGGLWPMVNGWWAVALDSRGHRAEASKIYNEMKTLNEQGSMPFPEYYHAKSKAAGGQPLCTWSAAMPLILHAQLNDTAQGLILC